jgi:glyoxylate reductase
VVVARRIPDAALARLRHAHDTWVSPHDRPLSAAELQDAVRGADGLVTLLHDRVDAALLDAAGPGLRVVANVAVGHDNIDLGACRARGVVATNTPGVLTDATADLAIALLLAVTRRLGEGERLLRRREPWAWSLDFMLGSGLAGRTLGIVGLGAIGQATARRARAFGMRIAYAGRGPADPAVEEELEAEFRELDELLASADAISLHCPLTPETRHLIDARRLAMMPPHAYLVNTARGPVVDESALVDALRHGTIAGAALDVFEHEPEVHPGLVELENAVIVPHLGSATVETRTAMAGLAVDNCLAVLAGDVPPTPIGGMAAPVKPLR